MRRSWLYGRRLGVTACYAIHKEEDNGKIDVDAIKVGATGAGSMPLFYIPFQQILLTLKHLIYSLNHFA